LDKKIKKHVLRISKERKLLYVLKDFSDTQLFQDHTQWEKNDETENLKDLLLEIRFPFSYLDFKKPPFPNHFS
jgi:hypothetical protein